MLQDGDALAFDPISSSIACTSSYLPADDDDAAADDDDAAADDAAAADDDDDEDNDDAPHMKSYRERVTSG